MSLYLDPDQIRALKSLIAMLEGDVENDETSIIVSADRIIETPTRVVMTAAEREKLAGLTQLEGSNLPLDQLSPPSDIIALNATTSAHGLLPKLSGIATDYFNGTGAFSAPKLDALTAPTDILTLNATADAHGLLPKLSGVGAEYLSGEGEWSTPRLDLLTAPLDNTNLDATIFVHGLLPKLAGDTTKYLRSDGTWDIPPGAGSAPKLDDCLAPDDNTDLNATTSAHGLLRKLSGVSTEYLSGTGVFSTPAGGGGSGGAAIGVNIADAPYSAAVDGTTDDTTIIEDAVADIIAAGDARSLIIPGSVKISGTLDLRGVSVLCLGNIVTTASTDMIIVGGDSTVGTPKVVEFRGTVGTATMTGAQATPILRVIGKNIQLTVGTCKYVQVYADGSAGATDSTAYCTFRLGHVKQLEVASINSGVGPSVGWINECLFVGGRVNSLKISSAGGTPYKHNNLIFYNVTIEPWGSEPFVIDLANCNSILVFGRFEVGSGLANAITLAASCGFIRFRRLYRSLVDKVYEPYNFPSNWIGAGTITDAALDTRWTYDGEEDREYVGLANTDAGSSLAAFTWLFNPTADVAVRPGDIIAWHFPAGGNFRAYAAFFDAAGTGITPTSGDVTTHLDVISSALAWSASPSGWFANSLLSGADITTAISRIIIIKAGSSARWARLGIRTGSATSSPPAGARIVIYRRPEFAGITPETRTQLVTSTAPGLTPTIPADATKFLRGDATWAVPSAGPTPKLDDLEAPDDNTDLNATTAAHGLLPKLGGGTTNFLRADGAWAAPGGGGGAAAGTTKQFWTNTPTIAQTDDVLVPRGPVTTFPLPALAAAAQQRIVVLNQATADVLVKASPTVGVVDGSLYADDTVNYVTRHQLNEVAVASASQLTLLAWLRCEDATGSRVAVKGRLSGTDFFMLRYAGDNAGANIGNYLCFETRLAGVRTSDHRFLAPFGSLYCVMLSINLNQASPTIKCRINGVLTAFDTVSPGPAWVQSSTIGGTQASSIYSIASGEAGQTRRSWRGLVAGVAAWRTYIDLADESLATLGYDDGPVALGQSGFSLNGVAPIFVFNNHGASFSNGGSLGGSWVDASGQSSPVAGTGADVGILERIWGFSTGVAQTPGEARTYVRNPSGGTWAAI